MNARDGRPGPATGVFTQDADQWFSSALRDPRVSDLPEPMRSLAKPIINALSIASALLEPEQMPDLGGREASSSWARNWEQTMNRVRADHVTAQGARQIANAQVLADAASELIAVWENSSIEERDAWLSTMTTFR